MVCGTEHHPYQSLSVTAAGRSERLRINEAKPSYAVYPQGMQQRPHVLPSADFRAVYVGPCQKPATRYGSSLRKNGDNEGKALAVCKHEALQTACCWSTSSICVQFCVVSVSTKCTINVTYNWCDIMHE